MQTALKPRQNAAAYLYAAALIALSAVINFFELRAHAGAALLLAAFFYLPALLLPRLSEWTLASLGIQLNLRALLVSGLFALILLAYFFLPGFGQWQDFYGHILQGVVRTAEELFFRGFLFALLHSLFRRFQPGFMAVLLSSLAFTFIYSPALFPAAQGTLPAIYAFSLVLALLRVWTGSVLPGLLLRLLLTFSPLTALVGLAIFALFIVWAARRGEIPLAQMLT